MPTLHLLPGEAPGDTAEIILSKVALRRLINALERAEQDSYAHVRFYQRDSVPFTLSIEIIESPRESPAWLSVPLAYMLNQHRRIYKDETGRRIDMDLLAAQLYSTRRLRRHNQRQAAKHIGVSLGTISSVENRSHVPKPKNLNKICDYLGKPHGHYYVPETSEGAAQRHAP